MLVDRLSGDNFQFNTETEFVPILGRVAAQLNTSPKEGADSAPGASSIQDNHHPALLSLLAEELSVSPEFIHDFELSVRSILYSYTCSPCGVAICTISSPPLSAG